ncbi:sugar kinase [Celeribacter sp. ULVN23_4]
MMKRFLAIGECMLELSAAGEALWQMGIAGDTLNTAWYARACLSDDWAVAYGTKIGNDVFSQRVPRFLKEAGIETDRLAYHPSRAVGLYAITLDKGERSFTYWRDTSAARTLADDPVQLRAMAQDAHVIHVSGITLAILPPEGRDALLAELARRRAEGCVTVLDPNVRPKLWPDMKTAAESLTAAAHVSQIVLPSFDDEQMCFGDADPGETLDRYLNAGAQTVVVKNGGGDIVVGHEGRTHRFDGLTRVTPIDTTGAGDSFNGAFIARLAMGASLSDAVATGHRIAMQVVRHRGALMPHSELRTASSS